MIPIFYGEAPGSGTDPPGARPEAPAIDRAPDGTSRDSNDALPRRKRVVTEARKEQNRVAQRIFRQRQRERRQAWERTRQRDSPQRPQLCPRSDTANDSDSMHATPDSQAYVHVEGQTTHPDDQTTVLFHQAPFGPSHMALADPHANALQFLPTTSFSAILHNIQSLGLDPQDIITCRPDCLSPFYRPSTPQDDPTALLTSTILTLPARAPEHLRPTLTQILVPHHPSFDLIPLPQLRDRAIMLSAAMPEIFNLWELKLDIYQNGGLSVRRHRDGRDSAPWDKTSWVAEPWFLSKWTMIVAEERDYLARNVF